MTLDVLFSPQALRAGAGDVTGRAVIVIDVLRATTTLCAALHHGARAVMIAADAEEATRLEQALGPADVVLAGERNCLRIPGFALGNSPREMVPAMVRGKTVIMTTTNGTHALLATGGASQVVVGAAANLTAVSDFASRVLQQQGDLLILCAGRGRGPGLDDAYLAGCIAVRALGGARRRKGLNDAAMIAMDLAIRYRHRIERVLSLSGAGRQLAAQGLREDIRAAAATDAYPVLPWFHERRVTLTRPEVT